MSEAIFKELLNDSLNREFAEFNNVPEHSFSLRHKVAMKHILAKYKKNYCEPKNESTLQSYPLFNFKRGGNLKQRIILVTIIIVMMAFLAGWTWIHFSLYKIDQGTLEGYTVNQDAIARVKEQLLSEGIDPDNRMPTHEITEEQIEWLGSRYDFDFLNACSFTHEEFGNFMLDLAYLNVFSLDEIENMYGVMPFNSNHSGYLYKLDTGDGISGYSNPFHLGGTMIDDDDELLAQLIMEYLKAKNVGLSDEEYERQSEEFAVQRKERLTVIDDLFARVCGNNINVMQQIQSVEDVSDKLKEDFGFLL